MTTEEIKNHIQLLAEQQYPNAAGSSRLMVLGFIKGYEAAKKELFTEEDLIQAITMATLETQYKNFLIENPASTLTYDEWFATNLSKPPEVISNLQPYTPSYISDNSGE